MSQSKEPIPKFDLLCQTQTGGYKSLGSYSNHARLCKSWCVTQWLQSYFKHFKEPFKFAHWHYT